MSSWYFPSIEPLGVENPWEWAVAASEEALLAQEEAELEEKWSEIKTANEGIILGKTTAENDPEEYDQDGEEEEVDNVEEESEGEEETV